MAIDPSTVISEQVTLAQTLSAAAFSAISAAIGPIGTGFTSGGGERLVLTPVPRESLGIGAPPQYSGYHYTNPGKTYGDPPSFEEFPGPDYGSAPTDTAVKPVLVTPQTPAQLADFLKDAPTLANIVLPTAPSIPSVFTPPTLTDIILPTAPQLGTLPVFDAVRPEANFDAPDNLDKVTEQQFSLASNNMRRVLESEIDVYLAKINPEYHTQMAAIEAKLTWYLAGGTALPVAVEQAIWNRARDKTGAEYLKARDQIMKEGASKGFTIPGGAQYSALNQSRQNAADNNARAAMDIAVKQAEMEQANMQFAVKQSADLRSMAVNATVGMAGTLAQINAQALDYAKSIVSALIEVFDAKIKLVTTLVEIYRADAEVYGTRLRAALVMFEVYKTEMEGAKIAAEVDQARVAAFSAQVQAWGAVAALYKAQVEGAMAAAELEKLKVSIFSAEVQAYSARVAGKEAEWRGYAAQIQGEAEKGQAYSAEVQADAERVRAWEAKIQGYKARVEAIASKNESAARVYTASVQGYAAAVQGEAAAVQAETSAFDATIRAYSAEAQAAEAQAKLGLSANETNLRSAIQLYDLVTHKQMHDMDLVTQKIQRQAEVAVSAGQVLAGMSSSATAGINSLAYVGQVTNV